MFHDPIGDYAKPNFWEITNQFSIKKHLANNLMTVNCTTNFQRNNLRSPPVLLLVRCLFRQKNRGPEHFGPRITPEPCRVFYSCWVFSNTHFTKKRTCSCSSNRSSSSLQVENHRNNMCTCFKPGPLHTSKTSCHNIHENPSPPPPPPQEKNRVT